MKQSKHQTVAYWMNMLSNQLSKRLMLTILLFSCVTMFHANPLDIDQKRVVTGYVTEKETGETLPGASVSVKGTTKGSMTDIDGKYSIEIDSNSEVLVFSYIGKKSTEITVGTHNTLDVALEDDATLLKEVVIQTGYMTQKKADLTGSLAIATASDIAKNPSGNAMKGLQGKLPGVFITSNGNPADEVGIQIRGITSLNASSPLVVLDGQPVDINMRDINTLNIESIQVLKDAASASIYGSRAASGVILIQTKKGKEGALSINYDGSVTFSTLAQKPKMLNTDGYGRALWQAHVNSGVDPSTIQLYTYDWNNDIRNPILYGLQPVPWLNGKNDESQRTMPSADTDWFDAATRTGITQRHQVTVSQGNDKSRSLFSLSYYDNEGYQIGTFFTQISARMNSEYDLIKGRLKVGENFETSYLKYRSANEIGNAVTMPPILPVHTNDGGWGGTAMEYGMDDIWNPVRLLEMGKHNTEKFNKVIGSAYMDLMIIDGLHAKTQFGINYSNAYHRHLRLSWKEGGGKKDDENGVENRQTHNLEYIWQNTLNYAKTFGKHDISAVAGVEYTKFEYEGFSAYKNEILIEDMDYALLHLADGSKINLNGYLDESALFSYFAKANYSFDSKYLFSATIRYDGSSKFGKNNRWGLFPAFSAGWRIKNEKFMEPLTYISDLKLRASWGVNGNSRPLSNNALTDIYAPNYGGDVYHRTSYALYGQETGLLQNGHRRIRTGNPDLKWEETKQTNLGFDFGFFDQRLNGSFDYFYKKTTGILFEPGYPGAFGEGGYQWINGASLDNRGVELIVSYSNDHSSPFQYTVSGNFSSYKNKFLEIPESNKYAYGGNGLDDHIVGRPRNSVYGYVADGIFKTQEEVDNSPQQDGKGIGRIRWKDLDGDGQITEIYDQTWIANTDPDFMIGISFTSQYKNVDFSMDWRGVFGQHVYDDWKKWGAFWTVTEQPGKNHLARVLDAWTPENPNSNIPALSTRNLNHEAGNSTYMFSDASYLKLSNIELGYTFPQSLIRKASMSRLRVYASAHNVLTIKKWWADDKFWGPDPEIADFNYLRPLEIMFGVNVSF